MSYLLNGIAIKTPTSFRRSLVEVEKSNTVLNGKKKRDFIRQKYSYTLDIQNLTQTQYSQIISIVQTKTIATFEVTETNLTIASVSVWVYIDGEDFVKGGQYRENLTLIIEEV